MDRKIEKKKWTTNRIILIISTVIFGFFVIYALTASKSSKQKIDFDRLSIKTVEQDFFRDYISFQGTVNPISTVYIDAMEGGRVEAIYLDDGAMVKEGDLILSLSNTDLNLNIMSREAGLSEQMNNLRNTRLSMEQNKLNLKKQLVDINFQIKKMKRQMDRNEKLYTKEMLSDEQYTAYKDEYEYMLQKKDLLIESQTQDSLFRAIQIEQLERSVYRMEENLSLVRKKLDNLEVKAPIKGQLVSINAEIGEAKSAGQRLGQINDISSYKIAADIDEHYISRVSINLPAEMEYSDSTYKLEIAKINPQVKNGTFNVEMRFTGDVPNDLRIGQTFRLMLQLGKPREAVIIPRGPFYHTTGGQWIFVIDQSGKTAHRRKIRISGQNPDFYEVAEGLEPGEKIITSGYENFKDIEQLKIKHKKDRG